VGPDQLVVVEDRVRARVPDPRQAGDGGQAAQQRREGQRVQSVAVAPRPPHLLAAVGVDGLAEESDLAGSGAGERLHFGHDRVGRSADLAAAGPRHDAEAAKQVAALHHRHVGATRVGGRKVGVTFGEVEALRRAGLLEAGGPLAPHRRLGHGRDPAEIVGAEDEVDLGETAQQGVALLLGHTAAHPQHTARTIGFPRSQPTEVAVEPVRRLVAD
jgi:hypothetical protein